MHYYINHIDFNLKLICFRISGYTVRIMKSQRFVFIDRSRASSSFDYCVLGGCYEHLLRIEIQRFEQA